MSPFYLFLSVVAFGVSFLGGGKVACWLYDRSNLDTMEYWLGLVISFCAHFVLFIVGLLFFGVWLPYYPYQTLAVVLALLTVIGLFFGRKIVGKISFPKIQLPKWTSKELLPSEAKVEPTKRSVYELFEG